MPSSPSDPPPSYSSQPPKDSNHHHRRHHHDKRSSKDSNLSRDDNDDATSGVRQNNSTSPSSGSKRHSDPHEKHHSGEKKMFSHDEILSLARQGMPRSKFGPEFLKRLEMQDLHSSSLKGMPKFRVITGAEAAKMYNDAIRREDHEDHESRSHDRHSDSKHGPVPYHNHDHNAVVFAFPGREAGSKIVDYYMTWKGKTPTQRLKGRRRRRDMLDEEFKKVVEGLENRYTEEKRQSILGPAQAESSTAQGHSHGHGHKHGHGGQRSRSAGEIPTVERVDDKGKDQKKRPEPSTMHSAPSVVQQQKKGASEIPEIFHADSEGEDEDEENRDTLGPLAIPARPVLTSRESSSSVTSLPYLGMIRGVPLGNRLPLTVMNPDPASTDSRRTSVASAAFTWANANKKDEYHVPVVSGSPLKNPPGLSAIEEGFDILEDTHSEEEDGKSVLTSLFSRKGGKVRRSKRSKPLDDSSSTSTSQSYDSRSLSGNSSSSRGSHGDNEEILIVLMDEQDPNLKDAKPPEVRVGDVKLSRKSSTKPPSRKVSARGSPWDGPAATAPSATLGLIDTKVPPQRNSSSASHYKYSPKHSPYSHHHSSHSSYSSLVGDDEIGDSSSWDTEESDDEDYKGRDRDSRVFQVGLKTALEALRFNSNRHAKTPSPRRTPSGGATGLPPVAPINFNPGTTVVTPITPPYAVPGLARLASQHASPYVNHNANQIHPHPHPVTQPSPAGSYGLAALYASPYPAQSISHLPPQSQTHTPMVQTLPLVQGPAPGQGQSPYVQPYVAMPLDHMSSHGTPLNPAGLALHPTPHHTPHHTPATAAALLASTYTSPYVNPAQLPVAAPGGLTMSNTTTAYVSQYGTPASRPSVSLYGGSVHGTPYNSGAGQQLYPASPYVRTGV
ncbi:hypothetical protein D9758_009946 [Tetrapyrgos nigripes]|uniref:Uncharacterized protein n=1 Tax=Tetrapyrgos nigripes TaxID=182062 RepID=A0A8H5CRP8_9AGAR|nr:hypothetical protein D9758_009946 [Tetrapyrgos nigripes]